MHVGDVSWLVWHFHFRNVAHGGQYLKKIYTSDLFLAHWLPFSWLESDKFLIFTASGSSSQQVLEVPSSLGALGGKPATNPGHKHQSSVQARSSDLEAMPGTSSPFPDIGASATGSRWPVSPAIDETPEVPQSIRFLQFLRAFTLARAVGQAGWERFLYRFFEVVS